MAIIKGIEFYANQEEVLARLHDKKHRFFGRKPGFARRNTPSVQAVQNLFWTTTKDDNNNTAWDDCNNNIEDICWCSHIRDDNRNSV
ncbi:hypothetical protein QE152_g7071 [Popillia japonica]|uniref:Uncharacterized protein n=1 Tax=Popillia japonica TaxID=7064 RepID=A0AAW1MCP8_POPJA